MTDCIQDTIAAPSGLLISTPDSIDNENNSEEESWSFQDLCLFVFSADPFCLSLFSLLPFFLLRFILRPELWRLLSPSAFAPRIALKPEIQDPDANLDK